MRKPGPKILLLDIETFPNIGYTWGKYDQNVIRYTQEKCLATFAAKWLNEKPVIAKALNSYPNYKPGSYDDVELVKELWQLLDAADVVVAHNGDAFDIKECNGRFIVHGLKPPKPFKTIDTKKAVKRVSRFNSNKLDDLGELLHIGRKIKTDFDLWAGCISGDSRSWRLMVDYNKKDVILLEKLYLRLRHWITNHPNFTVLDRSWCVKCGSKNIQYRGFAIRGKSRFRRFQCQECGGWGTVTKSEDTARVVNL